MAKHIDSLQQAVPDESPRRSLLREIGSFLFDVAKVAVISLAIIIPARTWLVQPFFVQGASMEPNFYEREYLVVDEISYRFGLPQRGDIVVFHPPQNPDEFYIKRIVGLPGETISLRGGRVFIVNAAHPDGVALDESPYLPVGTVTRATTAQLAEGAGLKLGSTEYFVLGDNRSNSQDSRAFGSLERLHIVGRAWLRGWPLGRAGSVPVPDYGL
jgi:signal peptidase I